MSSERLRRVGTGNRIRDKATLNRFFSLHYLLPFILAALAGLHLLALHEHGSNNPLGFSSNVDKIRFHPYYTYKDLVGFVAFILVLILFLFYSPNALGHSDNYIQANRLVTPAHISPEFYFLRVGGEGWEWSVVEILRLVEIASVLVILLGGFRLLNKAKTFRTKRTKTLRTTSSKGKTTLTGVSSILPEIIGNMPRITNLVNQLTVIVETSVLNGISWLNLDGFSDGKSRRAMHSSGVTYNNRRVKSDTNWQGDKFLILIATVLLLWYVPLFNKPVEVTAYDLAMNNVLFSSKLGGLRGPILAGNLGAKGSRCVPGKLVRGWALSNLLFSQGFGYATGKKGNSIFNEVLGRRSINNRYCDLYNLLCNPDFLRIAYETIKSNPGNMTRGVDRETLDKINNEWFEKLSEDISKGEYKFRPVRLVEIPKPKGGLRPLGVGSPRDKIIQKAIQIILEAIFEPLFLETSCGFRPGRGTHTALAKVRVGGKSHPWVINGDISKCFDRIPHSIIFSQLRKNIDDEKFIELIANHLKAGTKLPNGDIRKLSMGVPQGSVVSPILSNIVLHELDQFMAKLKGRYHNLVEREKSKAYERIIYKIKTVRAKLATCDQNNHSMEVEKLRAEKLELIKLRRITSRSKKVNSKFRRLFYIRYADDFVIFVTGPLKEVQYIRILIANELKKRCGLDLNLEKTSIQNTRKEWFTFLGAECKNIRHEARVFTKVHNRRQQASSFTRVHAPIHLLERKLVDAGYARGIGFKPTAIRSLVWQPHDKILAHYNMKVQGIVNYYSFAGNRGKLIKIVELLRLSCALTFALKYKLRTAAKVFKRFGKDLKCSLTKATFKRYNSLAAIHKYYNSSPSHYDLYKLIDQKWLNLTDSNLYRSPKGGQGGRRNYY